jgi:hypothetical protein
VNEKTNEAQNSQGGAGAAPCDAFLEIRPGIFIVVLATTLLFMCKIGVFSGATGIVLCSLSALLLVAVGGCLFGRYRRRQQLLAAESEKMMLAYQDRIRQYCRVLGQIDHGACQKEYGLTGPQSRRLLAGLEKMGTLKAYGKKSNMVYKLSDWKNIPIN